MANPKVIYKSAKASPAVKAAPAINASTKMSADSKRVITIASVTLFAVLILGLFLFFGQKFVGKAIAFDTTAIGMNQVGIPVSGSAEVGEIITLPVYVNLGAEKSYAFKVTASASPFENIELLGKAVPPGIMILEEDYSVPGAVTFIGASLAGPTDEESPPLALTGTVNLFNLSFKAVSVAESVVVKIDEVEMYNENEQLLPLTKKETTFAITEKAGVCGDGKKEGKEGCDDGNVLSGDGCNEKCNVVCIDSDSGKEGDSLLTQGTVKGVNVKGIFGSKSDECTSAYGGVKLGEYYCADPQSYDFVVTECPAGMACEEGACVKVKYCDDTDGFDFLQKGKVTSDTYPQGKEDYCAAENQWGISYVLEYSCDPTYGAIYTQKNCDEAKKGYKCQNGACVQEVVYKETSCTNQVDDDYDQLVDCLDLDCLGSKNALGKTCCGDDSNCASGESCDAATKTCAVKVIPAVCGDGKVESGEECDDGDVDDADECSNNCKKTSCKDSDGGINLLEQGTVVAGTLTETDSCIDNVIVKEGICVNGAYASTQKNCLGLGEGYSCNGGTCIFGLSESENVCSDGKDDDGDGSIDCADSDCAGYTCAEGKTCYQSKCIETPEKICTDAVDNDEDGKTDCEDSNCATDVNCADGDGDGIVDAGDKCPAKGAINKVYLAGANSGCEYGDVDGDGCVSMPNLMSYIGLWKKGEATMPNLMAAIASWKAGC